MHTKSLQLSFLPYSFGQKIEDFFPLLTFIGTIYYTGYDVYEHLLKSQPYFGFNVSKVELYFSDANLIGVSTYLDETAAYIEDVKDSLIAYFNENPSVVQNDILRSIGEIIYSWEDDKHLVGLLSDIEEQVFLHVILKDYRLLW